MTFRGLVSPPYDIANFSGSFSLAQKRYPYVDGASFDNVGRDPIPMSFKLYFLNTLGEDLFPELFEKWVNGLILDGRVGELEHPLLGSMNVMPKSWSVQLSANTTSGIIMDVSFIETIQDPENATSSTIVAEFPVVRVAAAAVDQDYSKLNLKWPDGARTDSLLDLVDQIEGLVFSARLTAEGVLNQAIGFIDNLLDSVENIASNSSRIWALVTNLTLISNSFRDIKERLGLQSEREVAQRTYEFNVSIDAVAADTGNSVGEIMTLNTSLLGQPTVPAGKPVSYFRDYPGA